MTEERIKELAEILIYSNWGERENGLYEELGRLIRTVAAEAREDTIRELNAEGRLIPT